MNRKQLTTPLLTALGLATAAGLALPLSAVAQQTSPAGTQQINQTNTGSEGSLPEQPEADLPDELVLTGIVRDFRERSEAGGHPDFERRPDNGFAHYMGNVDTYLDEDNKPVFTGQGAKVRHQWRDAEGRPIHPSLFNADAGDSPGQYGPDDPGGIESKDSFAQWFRTVPGVNAAKQFSITLQRQGDSNLYVFDDREDDVFSSLGGFFPINNEMYGNSDGESKNFHFTYELSTTFIYRPGSGQQFTFIGDDDVWVFINGQLVIDIGGVHAAVTQTVDLDRLDFLIPEEENTLHFFFAERHRTQSNFRIETSINLKNAELPNSSHLYD